MPVQAQRGQQQSAGGSGERLAAAGQRVPDGLGDAQIRRCRAREIAGNQGLMVVGQVHDAIGGRSGRGKNVEIGRTC
ncbi:hypothetical protein [Nocardia sp. NPDC059239]|uniref:hypothetical protein n=1 Tax=Nocardia sp. NPDC059239 TaxID=3346785 RepID=UPI003691C8B6